jgi:hypothetical protein
MGAVAQVKKTQKKPKPLTIRERRLLEEIPKHDTYTAALKAAGYSDSVAETHTGRTVNTALEKVKNLEVWEKAGLTDEYLAKKHVEGLDATKIHGTTDDFVEIADFMARNRYLDMAYKLKGLYPEKSAKQQPVSINGENVQIIFGLPEESE